ncbi:MAG: xanthine dehydrogenase family protein subunit M [Pirellulaceae bacterium]
MRDFEYLAPTTLAEAVDLTATHHSRARPLAGGTDLIDHLRTGRLQPDLLIDIKKIPELNVLQANGNGLRLGAAVPCYRVYGDADVSRDYTALAESCRIIGGIQIQSRATVGGNLCNASPAADVIPSVIVLAGVCVIAGPGGTRTVPAEQFCRGPGENVLEPGELLVEIEFPTRPAHGGSHYRRLIPRNEMDIAVVGVGASVVLDEGKQRFVSARIALGAVAPTPLVAVAAGEALAGQAVTDETIARAVAAAREIASPISDMRGTREYRLHATGVLTERVVKAAVARARGETVSYKLNR